MESPVGTVASTEPPYAAALAVLVQPDVDRLVAHLQAADPTLGADVVPRWRLLLISRLGQLLDEVLHGELLAWRMVRLPFGGVNPSEVDAQFVERVVRADGAWIADRYPEAARLREVLRHRWFDAAAEFHKRLVADRSALAGAFGIRVDTPLVALAPGAGDSHQGGRSVVCLQFADGRRLVYKPRSVRPEHILARLVSAVAESCGDPSWTPVAVVDRGGHGWMEYVEPEPARDATEIKRFFRRGGVLLAVAHALGMNDLHFENVIARRDAPVVIDAETLLPAAVTGSPGADLDPAGREQERTVLGTGLLPRWVPVYRQRTDLAEPALVQLGGLGPTDRTALPGFRWTDHAGRPERSVVLVTGVAAPNLPVLDGVQRTADDHRDELVDGFTAALLAMRRPEVRARLAADVAAAQSTTVRVVVRNTSGYLAAIRAGTSRRALRDHEVRQTILRQRLGAATTSHGAPTGRAELRALSDLDVPLLVAGATGTAVISLGPDGRPDGPTEMRLQTAPGPESARRGATVTGDDDERHLRRQVDIVRSSLVRPWPVVESAGPDTADPQPTIDGHWLAVAERQVADLADQLVCSAVRAKQRVGWLAVRRDVATTTTMAGPAGWGMYHGSLGIALFLAEAGRRLGTRRWSDVTETALATTSAHLRWAIGSDAPLDGGAVDLGLAGGFGGAVWALARLALVLDQPELTELSATIAAHAHARSMPGRRLIDVESGLAGLLVGLDELQAVAGATIVGELRRTVREELTAESPSGMAAHPDARSADDGLRHGLAGRLDRAAARGGQDEATMRLLDRPPDRLRLVGPGMPAWLVPGLADGLAGVGMAWLRVLAPSVTGTPFVRPSRL